MSFKVCSRFYVFTNSVAERCVDNVPLVDHFCRRFAQQLVDQVAKLLRLRSLFLWPCNYITAILSPGLLIWDTKRNTIDQSIEKQQAMFSNNNQHIQNGIYCTPLHGCHKVQSLPVYTNCVTAYCGFQYVTITIEEKKVVYPNWLILTLTPTLLNTVN